MCESILPRERAKITTQHTQQEGIDRNKKERFSGSSFTAWFFVEHSGPNWNLDNSLTNSTGCLTFEAAEVWWGKLIIKTSSKRLKDSECNYLKSHKLVIGFWCPRVNFNLVFCRNSKKFNAMEIHWKTTKTKEIKYFSHFLVFFGAVTYKQPEAKPFRLLS